MSCRLPSNRRMARTDLSQPRDEITFRCAPCRRTFSIPPGRVEDAPEQDWHPWAYFAACPSCGDEVPQAAWERAAFKAWTRATGPRTPEGIAATAANLVGHPTPEEALRTRFNRMKHGLHAKTATYFPARPDGYAFCSSCEVDREFCGRQVACQKRTELFMLHHAAFDSKNPRALAEIYADLQAGIFAVIQQILQTIIADGVKIEAPQYYTDKDGVLIIAQYVGDDGKLHVIKDIQAHPLFRPLGELLSRNNLSLADMGMTAKAMDDEQAEFGRLKAAGETREALTEFARSQARAVEALSGLMHRAGAKRDADPILIEYQQQNGGAGGGEA